MTSSNPESGTITYTYDNNGNVATKVAPAPNQTGSATVTTTYSYDTLNRLTQKSYSDGSTPTVNYGYDQSAPYGWNLSNYIGRLTTASTAASAGVQTANLYNYDPMGRFSLREQCQPQNCAPAPSLYAAYSYNLLGSPTSVQFGENGVWSTTLSYTYDAAGRPTTVTSSLVDAQHPATLYSVDPTIGYFPSGATRKSTLANGLTESNVYNNRLQPCLIEVNNNSTTLQTCNDSTPAGNVLDFWMGYNAGTSNNGNVVNWNATGVQSFVRTYSYDSLNRISTMSDSATSQACKGLSWTIDPWGNRTDQTLTGGTCSTFHASVGTNNRLFDPINNAYQYDAAGNMIYDGTHNYTYDAENRLIQVDSGATAKYTYDAEGHRVLNTSGGVQSFIYDEDGRVIADVTGTGNWNAGYVYLGGSLIAQYRDSTTYSIFGDHLGSTRLITRLDNSVYDSLDYLPFGEQIAGDTGTSHKFTGKERDSESGLDNFGARFDSSTLGRFMSPDWSSGPTPVPYASVSNPQSLNLYSYVQNNPLRFNDPSGHAPCTADGEKHGSLWCWAHRHGLVETKEETAARLKKQEEEYQKNREWYIKTFGHAPEVDAMTQLLTGYGLALGAIGAAEPTPVLQNANYAQTTFNEGFSSEGAFAGETVEGLAAKLQSGTKNPADVPVQYIVRDGNTLILNTRSAQALERAGIPRSQWVAVNVTGDPSAEARLTNQLQRNGLTSAGTPSVKQQ